MNNPLFSKITSDYYIRHYEIDPKFTEGLQVTVYAECAPNTEGVNGHYYYLDIYLSVDNIAVLDHIVGVTFGEGKMDQFHLDATIDNWIVGIVNQETFSAQLRAYMKKEKVWEQALENGILNDTDIDE